MIRKEWFRPKKLRVLLAWIGVPLLIFFADISDTSYRWGAVLMTVGETIRIWALGFVEKKGKKLAMSGPYAFVRNPLYAGNFFLGLGLVVICGNWILIAIFLVGFSILYAGTVRHEEEDLKERFGKDYEDYRGNVPKFLPRLTHYNASEKTFFDWRRVFKHHEYVTTLGIILLLCGIHLYDAIFLKKEPASTQTGLIIFSLIVGAVLAFERLFISDLKRVFTEGLPNFFIKKKQ